MLFCYSKHAVDVKQRVTAGEQRLKSERISITVELLLKQRTGTRLYWEQVKLQDHPVTSSEVFLDTGWTQMLHAELRPHRDNSKPQHFTLMSLKRNVAKLQYSQLHYW